VTQQLRAVVAAVVDRVLNGGDLDAVDELFTPELAPSAKAWVAPFRESFPDVHMATVALIAESNTEEDAATGAVAGRFRCSGTHLGDWLGHPGTGRRFVDVDEVYFFTVRDGRIAAWWGLEDNEDRFRQLGAPRPE
jgi:predicted ester cyclase